jgi:hypothetical protein
MASAKRIEHSSAPVGVMGDARPVVKSFVLVKGMLDAP